MNTKDWLVQVVTSCPDRETNSRGLGKFQPRDFVKIMNDCYTVGRRQSSLNILTALSAFIDETLFIETTVSGWLLGKERTYRGDSRERKEGARDRDKESKRQK